MMTRNGTPVEMRWFLLDVGHANYPEVLAALRAAHEKGSLALSVNARNDRTQALVKLLGPTPVLSAGQRGAILRTYTDADHAEARVLVKTRATDQDASAGWQAPEVAPQPR